MKMQILSIGNSFSQDAQSYLHGIACAGGEAVETVNLYIGGCSLCTHYENMKENARAYVLECNGVHTGFPVSIAEALNNRAWDVITLQQVSGQSFRFATYEPYLSALAAYVREKAPNAKLYLHQTWAYEKESERLSDVGFSDPHAMFAAVKEAYAAAAQTVQADGIIPSGALFVRLLDSGITKIHRDTFHASLGVGRYALGLLWYRVLTGKSVAENGFFPPYAPVDAQEAYSVRAVVEAVAKEYGY